MKKNILFSVAILLQCCYAISVEAQQTRKPPTPKVPQLPANRVRKPAATATAAASATTATRTQAAAAPQQARTIESAEDARNYRELVAGATSYMKQQQKQMQNIYDLKAHYQRGWRDDQNHIMEWGSDANTTLKVTFTEVAMYFPDTQTWAWINFTNPAMDEVVRYGKRKGFAELSSESVEGVDAAKAEQLCAVTAFILYAKGYEIIGTKDESHSLYVVLNNIEKKD